MLQIINLVYKPSGEAVPVVKMRVKEHGGVQFFAYLHDEWHWVDAELFGEPVAAVVQLDRRVHVDDDFDARSLD